MSSTVTSYHLPLNSASRCFPKLRRLEACARAAVCTNGSKMRTVYLPCKPPPSPARRHTVSTHAAAAVVVSIQERRAPALGGRRSWVL